MRFLEAPEVLLHAADAGVAWGTGYLLEILLPILLSLLMVIEPRLQMSAPSEAVLLLTTLERIVSAPSCR